MIRTVLKTLLTGVVPAMMTLLLAIGSLQASVVTLDMTVNGGTSPVTIDVGETVSVQIYGIVTDNNYSGTDLGLAFYRTDLLTTGGYLDPVEGWDPIGEMWDGEWDVQWAVPELTIRARGNTENAGSDDDVLGHGALPAVPGPSNAEIAVTRTLLASGLFEGVSEGTTTISLSNVSANVIWYDGVYIARQADTVNVLGGAEVTVNNPRLGDMDGSNGAIEPNGNDINPFVLALVGRPAYEAAFPGLNADARGDCAQDDGLLNGNDINPFVQMLVGGSQAIPEPATMALLALGGLAMLRRRRK